MHVLKIRFESSPSKASRALFDTVPGEEDHCEKTPAMDVFLVSSKSLNMEKIWRSLDERVPP